jgi:predicted AAA+ superfamily ATPase
VGAREDEPRVPHLEGLVLADLIAWREADPRRPEILYWRTTEGEEVDFVVEDGDRLLPIEVKAAKRPRSSHAAHLRTFLAQYPDAAPGALLLHGGEEVFWVSKRVLATPWWRVV